MCISVRREFLQRQKAVFIVIVQNSPNYHQRQTQYCPVPSWRFDKLESSLRGCCSMSLILGW